MERKTYVGWSDYIGWGDSIFMPWDLAEWSGKNQKILSLVLRWTREVVFVSVYLCGFSALC